LLVVAAAASAVAVVAAVGVHGGGAVDVRGYVVCVLIVSKYSVREAFSSLSLSLVHTPDK
jgi:hypothetical protein